MVRRGGRRFEFVRGLKIPGNHLLLLPDLVQKSTSFARRGSRVNGGSTPQRVSGIHQRFLGAPGRVAKLGAGFAD
jgi:hypothetical protein